MSVLNEIEKLIQERLKLDSIKNELDSTNSMSTIADIVESLSESEAKGLLKLYVYDRED